MAMPGPSAAGLCRAQCALTSAPRPSTPPLIKTSISARSRSRRRGVDRRSSHFPMRLKITPDMSREPRYPSTRQRQ